MNLKKILTGGIVGGILFLFFSWIIYGILLKGYMDSYSNPNLMRPPESIIWWALIVSNLCWGFLLTIILLKWNLQDRFSGARTGAWIGLFIATAIDTGIYATYQLAPNIKPVLVDILASVIIWSFSAEILRWMLKKFP